VSTQKICWSLLTFDYQGIIDAIQGNREDYFAEFDIFVRMEKSWIVMSIAPIYISLVLNCIVLVDLYLTLKNPFLPKKKRAPAYYVAAILGIIPPILVVSLLIMGIGN